MFIAKLFLSSTRKNAAMILPVLLGFAVSVFAQSDVRDAVYGKPKNAKKTTSSNNLNKSKTTPKPTPPKPTQVAAKPTPIPTPIRKKPVVKLLPVTFTANEAMVEVWLNDKNIGQTDAKFQFSKKIAPGEYRLMAKNKRQVLVSRKITIDTGQTEFALFEKPAPTLKVIAQKVEVELPKEKTEEEILKEIIIRLKNVFETYENPATTDSVTAEDWQFVFQAVNAGQFLGNTAVQIEAQRWFASGQIEFARKDYKAAFTAYYKAISNMPLWAFPVYELGNTYLANGQPEEAIKAYQKALQLNGKLGMVYKKLGDTQRGLDKEKEALTAYELAAQNGYKTFETRYFIAALRIENKQIEKGIEELEALVNEMPSADLYVKLGEAYEKLKRPLPAIDNYQKAIDLDPNTAQAHYRIGGMFMSQREYPKAKMSLEKALALDPKGKVLDIKDAQKKLREIAVKANNR